MDNSENSYEILICRLCLNIASGKYAFVDDITLDKLENISLEMTKTVPCGSILCDKCDQLLLKNVFLKAQIYKTEQTFMNDIEETEHHLDYKQVLSYMDDTSANVRNVAYKEWNCKICSKVNEDTFEDDLVKEAIKKLSYNLGFRIARNSKICKCCTELIYDLISFKNICMNTQEIINNYCTDFGVNDSSVVDLCHVKFHQIYSNRSFDNLGSSVESVSYTPVYEDHESTAVTDYLSKFDVSEVELEDYRNSPVLDNGSNKENHEVLTYELVEVKENPMYHNGFCTYRCPKCNELVENVEDHSIRHKNISTVIKYGCIKCEYTNESKENLETHFSTHSQVSISKKVFYSCNQCPFKSSDRGNFKTHMLVHANPEEIKMFKCSKCKFQARQKGNLKTHLLVHEKPDEITMFKCSKCKFQARQKGNLKTHLLVHEKPEEITMFKCNECKFQARQKGNLQTHKFKKHGKVKENRRGSSLFIKCEFCPYTSKGEACTKRHFKSHKTSL
ncbi:uncharacterized protein [Leptinotarsa decemlineata]|uniref:uncharacterized protein n=1 Tax=Leptinotarsa decemlineata TaxID=7539 RepID=UPI003D30716E